MSITRSTTIWCDADKNSDCEHRIALSGIGTAQEIREALEQNGWTTDDDHVTHICQACKEQEY